MDKTKGPQSTTDEDAKFEAAYRESMAEAERTKEETAHEQVEIERLKAETRAMSENIDGDSKERVKTEEPSRQLTATVSEMVSSKKPGSLLSRLWRFCCQSLYGSREEQSLNEQQVVLSRRQVLFNFIGTLLAVIGIFLGVVAVIIGIVSIWDKLASVQVAVKQSQFVITSPPDGAEVGLGQKVRGKTPYLKMNHYIVVTLVRLGTSYVQDQPAFVSPDGTFSGDARFGDRTIGEDDEFTIRVLATKSTLPAGPLTNVPNDAVFSEFVTVRRVQSLPVAGSQVVIIAPKDGALVSLDDKILGKTSFPDMNHYIVVTPVRTGTAYVQDQPAQVNRDDGTFSGTARFGGAEVGVGEQFIVRVLATKSTLPAAPLIKEPEDAVVSNSVIVKRTK